MSDRPQEAPQDPSSNEHLREALGPFALECPKCKRTLDEYAATCPNCGAELLAEYSGTYRVSHGPVAKIIAWTVLVVFIGSILVAFGLALRGRP